MDQMDYDNSYCIQSFWTIEIPIFIKLIRGYTSSIVCKIIFGIICLTPTVNKLCKTIRWIILILRINAMVDFPITLFNYVLTNYFDRHLHSTNSHLFIIRLKGYINSERVTSFFCPSVHAWMKCVTNRLK